MNKKLIYIILIILVLGAGYILWSQSSSIFNGNSKEDPQKTLDAFIEALEKNDLELASSYFIEDGQISRSDWKKSFELLVERELLDDMVRDIKEKSKPDPDNDDGNEYRYFLEEDGVTSAVIVLRYNEERRVWEIESI